MSLIDATHYPAVRAAMDLALDDKMVSDDLIASSIYQGAAEAEVLRLDPLASSRTGGDQTHIQNAVILFTAALMTPALAPLQAANMNQAEYGKREHNVEVDIARLRARAQAEINSVLNPGDDTAGMPTFFTVGTGERGR